MCECICVVSRGTAGLCNLHHHHHHLMLLLSLHNLHQNKSTNHTIRRPAALCVLVKLSVLSARTHDRRLISVSAGLLRKYRKYGGEAATGEGLNIIQFSLCKHHNGQDHFPQIACVLAKRNDTSSSLCAFGLQQHHMAERSRGCAFIPKSESSV